MFTMGGVCLSPPVTSHSNSTSRFQLSLTLSCHSLSWSVCPFAGPMIGRGTVNTKASKADFCYIQRKTYGGSYFGVNHVLAFTPSFHLLGPSQNRTGLLWQSRVCPSGLQPWLGCVQTSRPTAPPAGVRCQLGTAGGAREQVGGGGMEAGPRGRLGQ